jgi:Fur family ferric uptake transcriptional regulator
LTSQRRIISRVLAETHDYPDADELHRRVAALNPSVSLATVYRTLRTFEQLGIVRRHTFQDGRARFEQAAVECSAHLIDLSDGRVIPVRSEELERLLAEVAQRLGYRIDSYLLHIYAIPNSPT